MLPINRKREVVLKALGQRLREYRLSRNDTQVIFAERIGVSEKTLREMENGAPGIGIGTWFDALDILGRTEDIHALLPAQARSLFDRKEPRKRVRRQRSRS